MKTIFSIVAACALLALAPTNASSQTVCEFVLGLADLANPGEIIDHKTDITNGGCTTQVIVKVDKSDPVVTKVDFKIDQACELSGQAQITGITLEIDGSETTSCNINYDNPADFMEVGEDTSIGDAPGFQQLLMDAADATAMQFPPGGDPTADALIAKLNVAAHSHAIEVEIYLDGVLLFFTGTEITASGEGAAAVQDAAGVITLSVGLCDPLGGFCRHLAQVNSNG